MNDSADWVTAYDHCPSFWLVNTAMSYHELYNHINAAVERNDMFYITSISSAGFGRLDPEDTNWIKKKFFIPLELHATPVNTRGPLSMRLNTEIG